MRQREEQMLTAYRLRIDGRIDAGCQYRFPSTLPSTWTIDEVLDAHAVCALVRQSLRQWNRGSLGNGREPHGEPSLKGRERACSTLCCAQRTSHAEGTRHQATRLAAWLLLAGVALLLGGGVMLGGRRRRSLG